MKIVRIYASIELEYQIEYYEEVDDARVNDIIAHQIDGEVIAQVQNNASWSVDE